MKYQEERFLRTAKEFVRSCIEEEKADCLLGPQEFIPNDSQGDFGGKDVDPRQPGSFSGAEQAKPSGILDNRPLLKRLLKELLEILTS